MSRIRSVFLTVCALLTFLLSGSSVSAQQGCPTQILNNWGACEKNGVVIKKGTQYNLASLKIEPEEKTTDLKYTNLGFLRYANTALNVWASKSVQTEYSFASLWNVGTGDLNSTSCPNFELIKPSGFNAVYPLLNGTPQSNGTIDWQTLALIPVVNGGVYCGVSFNNIFQYKFKVTSVGVKNITINIRWVRETQLKTYRCADGFCNTNARSYCVGSRKAVKGHLRSSWVRQCSQWSGADYGFSNWARTYSRQPFLRGPRSRVRVRVYV